MAAQSYTIDIPQAQLDDLRERLADTRWPDEIDGAGWSYGTNLAYMKEFVAYWKDSFDWRTQEAQLNRFAQFKTDVDGLGIHFIHERGKGPNPTPLLLIHGWPDSIYRFHKLIPLLTDPAAHGGDPADSFDIVAPSIPGYGFSDKPAKPGMDPASVADLFTKLMTEELGYARFIAHGGDWGSGITEQLARKHAGALLGIHLTDIPYSHIFATPPEVLTEPEKRFLQAGQRWYMTEGAYGMLQGTKPQTLAFGMNDSPAGMAAWLLEKFQSWADTGGDIESRFSKDELLTNIMIYWLTETFGSAARIYYESQHSQSAHDSSRVAVPTGAAIFPHDLVPSPREYGERFFNIVRWAELPRGGHFAAWEEPGLLAGELQAFARTLRGEP